MPALHIDAVPIRLEVLPLLRLAGERPRVAIQAARHAAARKCCCISRAIKVQPCWLRFSCWTGHPAQSKDLMKPLLVRYRCVVTRQHSRRRATAGRQAQDTLAQAVQHQRVQRQVERRQQVSGPQRSFPGSCTGSLAPLALERSEKANAHSCTPLSCQVPADSHPVRQVNMMVEHRCP